MSWSTKIQAVAFATLAACSGGAGGGDDEPGLDAVAIDARPIDGPIDAAGGNGGFVTPFGVTKANTESGGVWTEVGDADWSCLGSPSTDQPSTGTIALGGRITDFQTGDGVGNASIMAWGTSPSMTVGTATSSDLAATRGDFSMTLGMLASGTRRYGFTVAAEDHVWTVVVGRYYPPGAAATDNIAIVSQATALALPAFIGLERDLTKALYLGSLKDCQGRAVSNAVAAVSAVPSTFSNAGGETFYFSAGSTSLPVRHTVEPVMNNDGLFVVMNVPPGADRHVQVWGFRTAAELGAGTLTLLAEIAAPSQTNQAVSMALGPRRI